VDEDEQFFADLVAERPEVGGVGGADESAESHRKIARVGNVETGDALVPQRVFGDDPLELAAHFFDRHLIADAKRDHAGQFGGGARSVLGGFVDEPGDRNDEEALVENTHNDVSKRNFLDAARLVLDHHDVAEAHRLRDRDMDACDKCLDAVLGGETNHDARQPRRGDYAHVELPDSKTQSALQLRDPCHWQSPMHRQHTPYTAACQPVFQYHIPDDTHQD
jgi:hypothetical protein